LREIGDTLAYLSGRVRLGAPFLQFFNLKSQISNLKLAVLVVGFIAAVSIGSIAWYNSKRPPGWESKERPDFVPKIDKDDLISDVSESKKK